MKSVIDFLILDTARDGQVPSALETGTDWLYTTRDSVSTTTKDSLDSGMWILPDFLETLLRVVETLGRLP